MDINEEIIGSIDELLTDDFSANLANKFRMVAEKIKNAKDKQIYPKNYPKELAKHLSSYLD